MTPPRPTGSSISELSTLSTTLTDVLRRVTGLAEGLATSEDTGDAASSLFDAERALRTAQRAIDRAGRQLS